MSSHPPASGSLGGMGSVGSMGSAENVGAVRSVPSVRSVRSAVLTTMSAEVTPVTPRGEPIRWWHLPADSCVASPANPWHVVLAVEQLLNRRVRRA